MGSEDRRLILPIVGQVRQALGLLRGHGTLAPDREVNPVAAERTATDEPGVVPPGSDERVVDRPAVIIRAEVDGVEAAVAARVGAFGDWVDDLRGCKSYLTADSIGLVYIVQVISGRGG